MPKSKRVRTNSRLFALTALQIEKRYKENTVKDRVKSIPELIDIERLDFLFLRLMKAKIQLQFRIKYYVVNM
jgi:hypothetical protein